MKSKKNIGIFFDHDLMIRHFIKKNQFLDLEKKFNVYYFFSNNKRRINTKLKKLKIKNFQKINIDLNRKSKNVVLDYAGRLNNAFGKQNQQFKTASLELIKKQINSRRQFYFYLLLSLTKTFNLYCWFFRKFKIKYNFYLENLIKKKNLSCIIHPSVLTGDFVQDLVEIGNKNKLPTILIMNSWDNCFSRSFTHGNPTKYLVWGKQVEKIACENLNLPKKNVDAIGSAQFEIYKKKPAVSTGDYRKLLGIKTKESLICYAGSNTGVNETKHLKIIDEQITKNNNKIKILYRPHPWKKFHKDEKNFFNLRYKNIIMDYFSVKRYKNYFSKRPKEINITDIDYDFTNTIIKSIEATIAPMSTFAIECALNRIPVSLYLPQSKEEYDEGYSIKTDYFSFLIKLIKPIVCKEEKDLYKTILKLNNMKNIKKIKKKFNANARKIVLFDNESYSQKILKKIEEVL